MTIDQQDRKAGGLTHQHLLNSALTLETLLCNYNRGSRSIKFDLCSHPTKSTRLTQKTKPTEQTEDGCCRVCLCVSQQMVHDRYLWRCWDDCCFTGPSPLTTRWGNELSKTHLTHESCSFSWHVLHVGFLRTHSDNNKSSKPLFLEASEQKNQWCIMGASSSGLLDDTKISHIKGKTRRTSLLFVPVIYVVTHVLSVYHNHKRELPRKQINKRNNWGYNWVLVVFVAVCNDCSICAFI